VADIRQSPVNTTAVVSEDPLQVEHFLEFNAAQSPAKTALVYGEHKLSYGSLDEASNQIAHGLIAMGIRRGDRVAVYLENSVEAVLAIFAVLKAGAVIVPVNPAMKLEKFISVLNNCGARVLVTHRSKIRTVQSSFDLAPQLETILLIGEFSGTSGSKQYVSWESLIGSASTQPIPKRCIDIDIAAIIYTSGSTGNPKGVTLSHLNMVTAATSVTEYLENLADDVIFNVLPLSFSYGLYQILTGFKMGATVVLERSFTYPHAALQRMLDEGVTGFPIVPTISALLLQLDLSKYQFPRLRYITAAGAALPVAHVTGLRKLFPESKLYLMYGLTECKRVSYLAPEQVDRRPTSVGKAMPNVEVFIVDDEGKALPPGQIGELVVRGSTVMQGYWMLPEETVKVLKPGPVTGERALYTGDLFRMDDEGFLYWLGRRDDIIKCRGEKVSPKEVEDVLHALAGVSMAAVVGVPDAILGQVIKAVITLKDGARLSENEVRRHCARYLEDFMIPRFIEIRKTLPRTPAGKIDKRELIMRKAL